MGIFVRKEKKYNDDVSVQKNALIETESPELVELALEGLDCDKLPNAKGSFGIFFRNPIITNGINGTLIYLSKLILESKKTSLIFHKLGSIQNSLTNIGTIDIYEVMDESGTHWDILFVDMYHPRRSNLAPEGYSLKQYDYDLGDSNKSFGTVNYCENFPLRISSALIKAGNSRYAIVGEIIDSLKENGVKFIPPENHTNKVNAIKEILKQQNSEENDD